MSRKSNRDQFAVYIEQSVRLYRGQPLIEALPPIITPEQVKKLATKRVDYSDEDRSLSKTDRLHSLKTVLRFREPLNVHFRVCEVIDGLIRYGYVGRELLSKDYWPNVIAGREGLRTGCYVAESSETTASGSAILGDSGTGKSTTVRSILGMYPQVIQHKEYKGKELRITQLVYLYVECSPDGSLKGLCQNVLKATDRVLGTNYEDLYWKNGRATAYDLLNAIYSIAAAHAIGLFLIDEIQNLRVAKGDNASIMINFLTYMINQLGVPVVLVGTPDAIRILTGKMATARRFSGPGDIIFHRMKKDREWDRFIQKMWKYQYVKNSSPMTPEIKDALYYESQGIIDLAVKVFILAQIRAITTDLESITVAVIHSATDNLTLVRQYLDALRGGKKTSVTYDDIYESVKINDLIDNAVMEIPNSPVTSTRDNNGLSANAKLGMSSNPGSESESPGQPSKTGTPKRRRSRKQKQKIVIKAGSLLEVWEQGKAAKITAYQALLDGGFIKPMTEIS